MTLKCETLSIITYINSALEYQSIMEYQNLACKLANFEKKKPNVHKKNATKHEHNPKTSLELKKH
jgi:hypothetical protein